MTSLIIDQGNTYAKVYVYQNDECIEKLSFENLLIPELTPFFKQHKIENCIISSVQMIDDGIINYLESQTKTIVFNQLSKLPIKIKYETPHTLGLDRIASSCGAMFLYPKQNCLVIDAGTCITYDFIDEYANYLGGAISPGMQMRFQALNTFTAKLPLVKIDNGQPNLIGNTTTNSIKSGVFYGLINEVDGFINQYLQQYPSMRCLLCGGDTTFFDSHLKNSIFAHPDLVAIGLHTILKFNVQQN